MLGYLVPGTEGTEHCENCELYPGTRSVPGYTLGTIVSSSNLTPIKNWSKVREKRGVTVQLYIDVRHLDVTRLNTFKSPSIHQLERLGFAQPGRPPLRPCTIKYMETLTWVQLVGKLGNKSGAQPWVCRTAHGMPCRPAVLSWRVIETN